jgi:hypothetical protein
VESENGYGSDRSTRVYIADDEDIRLSGLVRVNDGLSAEVPLWCSGVQVDRYPDDGLPRRVFESFMTARMAVSVGRLPQEVLLEEFYRR